MLKYESTEIALKTLISMHNIELEDRKISVAFSKERL